jgi:HSP20 family protein
MTHKIPEQEKQEKQEKRGQNPAGNVQVSKQQQQPRGRELERREGRSPQQYRGGFNASPFTLMRRMMDDFERLFDAPMFGRSFVPDFLGGEEDIFPTTMRTEIWNPSLEVFQRGNDLVVRADLPGIRKEDVRLEIENDNLCIEGERRFEEEKRERGMYRSERSYGTFRRVIPLPEGVDTDSVTANMKDGVLEVTVKVPEQTRRGRQIQIGEGEGTRQEKREEQPAEAEAPSVH